MGESKYFLRKIDSFKEQVKEIKFKIIKNLFSTFVSHRLKEIISKHKQKSQIE